MLTQPSPDELIFRCWLQPLFYRPYPPMHLHDFHEIFLCVDGEGVQTTERGAYPMQPGDLFFFAAGQSHGALCLPEGACSGIVLFFTDALLLNTASSDSDVAVILDYLRQCSTEGVYPIVTHASPGSAVATHILRAMTKEFDEKLPGYRFAMRTHLQALLLCFLRDPCIGPALASKFHPVKPLERLAHVYLYLRSNYMYPIDVEQAAGMAHLCRSRFHQVFKEETGVTFTAYLNELRVQAAAHMLREGEIPILEVAYQCGFSSVSHFYAVFKQHLDCTPQSLRDKNAAGKPGQ